MNIAGIILAAGRGSRMRHLTENRPKCLLELAGKPLLEWQTQAMRAAGVKDLLVIRGYKAEKITGDFQTTENVRWAETNMFSTLLCAEKFAMDFFANGGDKILVAYSDIVWRPEHAKKLLACGEHIAMAYDLRWEELWRLRFDDPLSDAETFEQENGLLREIGGKTDDITRIHGQYMGLLAFDRQGFQAALDCGRDLGAAADKTDMTTFLRYLLARNIPVGVAPVEGGWCEADSAEDIEKYEKALALGNWGHDWR